MKKGKKILDTVMVMKMAACLKNDDIAITM